MPSEERALAAGRGLVPAGPPPGDRVGESRARLAAALAEVTALDAEVEELSAALAAFAAELSRRLEQPDGEARRAAALVRRLQGLADGLESERARVEAGRRARGRAGGAPGGPRRRGRGGRGAGPAAGPPGAGEQPGGPDEEAGPLPRRDGGADAAGVAPEDPAVALKRLYRRLARLLHPDLAPDAAEARRLSGLMAGVNAAYAAGDLPALELMAEKLGAGEPLEALDDEERLAHLGRRIEQLLRVASSLRRERERLRRSDTARVRQAAERRAAEGGDWFEESEAALREEAAAARADALARLGALERAARALTQARRKAMSELERKGTGAVRRPFDPLSESALVRRSAARLDRARAGPAARELARWLEEAAGRSAWEAGLTMLAFLGEAAGERPPPAVATAAGLAERWELLRAGWPGAPDLAGALARLPRHLSLGARAGAEEVTAGLQLAEAGLAAGVRLALEREAVAAQAREVLAALGPAERCGACRARVLGLHLLRTRGLDERHAIACPRCGAVLRSYWSYGEPEGLEALAPLALELGLVAELTVALGDESLGFQMLPEERDALPARGLLARFGELYLEPCGVDLPAGALRLIGPRGPLAARARVAGAGRLRLEVAPEAGTTADGLVELLRTRIERRFRPG